jgi:hypothetical protein
LKEAERMKTTVENDSPAADGSSREYTALARCALPPRGVLLAGVLVFLLFSVGAIALEAIALRSIAISLAEREAKFIGHHLEQLYFRPGLFLDDEGKIEIPNPLPEDVRQELEALGIVKLKVYDIAGRIIASTDSIQVGWEREESPHFQEALKGQVIAHLSTRESYRNFYGEEVSEDLLEIYVPVWSAAANVPAGIMEIYRPWSFYSPVIEKGLLLTIGVSGGLTVIFGIALLVIHFWVTGRARNVEQIIAELQESLERSRREGPSPLS